MFCCIDSTSNGIRQRKPVVEDNDMDTVLKHHRKMHEKLTEELLHHTLNLKDFANAANTIVKKDIEVSLSLYNVYLHIGGSLCVLRASWDVHTCVCTRIGWHMFDLVALVYSFFVR